jgi:hypothetical protein
MSEELYTFVPGYKKTNPEICLLDRDSGGLRCKFSFFPNQSEKKMKK